MTHEMNPEGIRLAYVHLSVTTPRTSGPVDATPAVRGRSRRQWHRVARSGPAGRVQALAG